MFVSKVRIVQYERELYDGGQIHVQRFMQVLLLLQFVGMKDHGTKIVLYNLWEDDQGQLELDFQTDPYVSNFTFFLRNIVISF